MKTKHPFRVRRLLQDQSGASALEFSIVGSLLFFCLLGILEVGWALYVRHALADAADRGIRYVLVNRNAADSAVQSYVLGLLPNYDRARLSVTSTTEVNGTISYRAVRVRYSFSFSGLPVSSVALSAERRTPAS